MCLSLPLPLILRSHRDSEMSPALFRSGGDRLHGVSHMPAPRSVFVCRVYAYIGAWRNDGAWHPWSSGYDVSPTRWRSPVRSWQGVLPGCWHISQAWSGSRRQVAALAASQATGIDIQTAAVLQPSALDHSAKLSCCLGIPARV